jgi:hypothetical protein
MAVWPVSEGGSYPGEPEPEQVEVQQPDAQPELKRSRPKLVKSDGE